MSRLRIPALLLCVALLGAFATGCQHNAMPASSMSAAPNDAVLAGKTTFVRVPTGQGQYNIVAYSAPGTAVCKDCEAAANQYFLTGKMDHATCKTCGANLYVGQSSMIRPH